MKKYFIYILLIVMSGLVLLTGCRWFADNPMFPTGKFEVSYKVMKEDGKKHGILGVVSVTDIISIAEGGTINSAASITTDTDIVSQIGSVWFTVTVDENGKPKITPIKLEGPVVSGSLDTTTTGLTSSESYVATITASFARVVGAPFSD